MTEISVCFFKTGNMICATNSRESSVGIAAGYGLDGLGSFPNRGKILLYSVISIPALGSTQPPIQWVLRAVSDWA
jgi:hypothetical protein